MKKTTKNAIKILESRITWCENRVEKNTIDTIASYYKGQIQAYEDAIKIIELEVKYEPQN